MAQEGQTATNPQTGQRVIFQGGRWVPVGGAAQPQPQPQPQPRGGVLTVPMPAQARRESDVGIENTQSQIQSRGVQDALTGAQTQGRLLENAQAAAAMETARTASARREGSLREEIAKTEAALQAISGARRANTNFATGRIGALVGDPNARDGYGEGLAAIPIIGPAFHAGSDKAELDTYRQIIQSGLTFDFLQSAMERAVAAGGSTAGMAQTNPAEFLALGTTQANLVGAQRAGVDVFAEQLDVAEEALLRKMAALRVPMDQLVAATSEQRFALLEDSYQRVLREYRGDPAEPSAALGAPGGGVLGAGRAVQPVVVGGQVGPRRSGDARPYPGLSGLGGELRGMAQEGASAQDMIRHLRARREAAGLPPVFRDQELALMSAARGARVEGWENFDNVTGEEVSAITSAIGELADTPVGAGIINFAEGVTLGGLDELAAMTGGRSAEEIALINNYLDEAHPFSSFAGRTFGSVASFLPISRGLNALTSAARFSPSAALAAQTGAGVLTGGVEGALESNEDRGTGALLGVGTAFLGDRVGNFMGNQLARRFANEPTGAEQAVAKATTDPDAVRGVLTEAERVGSPVALADTSPALRDLAGVSVRNSRSSGLLADNTIQPRDLEQVNRAVAAVERTLGSPRVNVTEAARTMRTQGQGAADPFYKRAFARPAPSSDPELANILQRPVLRDGLAEAQRTLSNRGRDWRAMGFDLNEQGEVMLRPGASFEALDQVKRGIDTVLRRPEYRDNFGRLDTRNPSVLAMVDAQQALVGRMRSLNDDYAAALDTYTPFAQNAEALELGSNSVAAGRSNDPMEIANIVSGMTDGQRANFQIGAANEIMRRIRETPDNSNAFSVFMREGMRERLAAIFPDRADGLADLRSITDLEAEMRRTREALLGGSATRGRAAADEAFAAETAGGVFGPLAEGGIALATGGVSAVLTGLVRAGRLAFKDANRLADLRNQEALAADLAPILMETDPAKARQMLDDILQNVDNYNRAVTTGRSVGRAVGAGTAAGVLNNSE